jgi:cytochrome c biogenesis protein CcdA/thiol-disulfide isomerase/thioredoxin
VIVLLLVGFLGGLVTGISPCILPVLPVIFASGAASGLEEKEDDTPIGAAVERDPVAVGATVGTAAGIGGPGVAADDAPPAPRVPSPERRRMESFGRRRRPFAVVGGLVLSFSVATLVGSWVLASLGLPQDLLRWLGIGVLGVLGIGLVVPAVGDLLERPFARIAVGRPVAEGGGFVLGLSLGLVFVPCAGPVLAAITTVGGDHRIGWSAVVLAAAFAAGVAVPLLFFALAGQYLATRMSAVRTHAATARRIVGAVLLVTAVVLALPGNVTDWFQRDLPGYTDALTNHIERNASATRALDGVRGISGGGALSNCTDGSPVLQECGKAPTFTGITQWLNTPGDRPLTMAGLKGRVVLVDFWTYSCINCQRSLPHVEAWNAAYAKDGLTVVGVHTPEFAFEHVVSNITRAAGQLGVRYPIAVDNDYGTWNAYQNSYWPAEYLIDATGTVRHVDFGEGGYAQTETFIRELLKAADPRVVLPPPTGVPDRTPQYQTTPESYLGYAHDEPNLAAESVIPDAMVSYAAPATLPADEYAFGGQWDIGSEAATAGADATLSLNFQAGDVYLVIGGAGAIEVDLDGRPSRTVVVGGEPKLYHLVGPGAYQQGTVTLHVPAGIMAYDFTFG